MSRRGNRAHSELQALHQATRQPLEQNQAQLQIAKAKRQPGITNPRALDKDGDGEAEFATPEALATAVGAAFILGPVGGILLGAAQGILGKQMKQNALDQWSEEQSAISDSQDIIQARIDSLRESAVSDEDREQISNMEAALKMGTRLAKGGDPRGQELMVQALNGLDAYTQRNEAQRIAREEADRQARVDLSNEQYNRNTGLRSTYRAESQEYVDVRKQANIMKEAIEKGDPAALQASLVILNKILDPTSVVRAEEAEAYGNIGNVMEQASTLVQKWIGTGQQASPEQRQALLDLTDILVRHNTASQLARDVKFQEYAIDAGLPAKYVNDYRMVTELPAYKPGPLQNVKASPAEAVAGEGSQLDRTRQAVTDVMEAADNGASGVYNWLMNGGFQDWYSGSGREARRKKREQARELPTN